MLDTVAKSERMHRQLAQQIFAQPLVTLSVPGPQPLPNSYNMSFVTQVLANCVAFMEISMALTEVEQACWVLHLPERKATMIEHFLFQIFSGLD